MCGRYALGIRAAYVRYQLQQQGLPVNDTVADDEARETFNFPPGAYGLVYRPDIPDSGLHETSEQSSETLVNSVTIADNDEAVATPPNDHEAEQGPVQYQIKAMKWGLIPFWTKRSPDYGSMLRTINCRDDSLIEDKGMWTTMKQRKRCIVIAQGFYEWLKKGPGGKEKIPHFVKRKDGNLMLFAGLWDCVKYENAEDKLYTYSIITTDSNKQLSFLHDRMPVILEPNTESTKLWLNPRQTKWTKDLQSMLKPYEGDLDCYPVNKEVGKVGNNSPDFIVPVDSKENKKNIANFFDNATKVSPSNKVDQEDVEHRQTKDSESSESCTPMPVPKQENGVSKRKQSGIGDERIVKAPRTSQSPLKSTVSVSPSVPSTRNAVSNKQAIIKTSSPKKSEVGTQKITNFFTK